MKGTPTTRTRGKSLKESCPLEAEEHPTKGDARQESTLENLGQISGQMA
jgi:hypothetical protein